MLLHLPGPNILYDHFWRICYLLRTTRAPLPRDIFLSVNSVCNARCIMCDVGIKKRSTFYEILTNHGEMSVDLIEKVANEFYWKPRIRITSTEPLLYSKIAYAMALLKERSFFLSITTNGVLLDKYVEKIIKYGLDELIVSIDGPPDLNNKIRGINKTDRIVESLKKLKQIRSDKPRIGINTVIMPVNYNQIYQTVEYYNDLADFHILSHMNYVSEDCTAIHNRLFPQYPMSPSCVFGIRPSLVDVDILSAELEKVLKDFKIILIPKIYSNDLLTKYYKEPKKPIRKDQKCAAPWRTAQIMPNGNILISTRCFNLSMGNLYESSFPKIWNGNKLRNFRKDLLRLKYFPVCNRCCGVF